MSKVDELLTAARKQLGVRYVFGAEKPGKAFDCSGLTAYVFGTVGISLPHSAAEQQRIAKKVKNPLPGDLVFYGDPAHHVGLYIGGGKMIAAPKTGDVVKVQSVYGNPTYGRISNIGAATATVVDAVGSAMGGLGQASGAVVSNVVGEVGTGARGIVFKSTGLLLGVGLLAVGMILVGKQGFQAGTKGE